PYHRHSRLGQRSPAEFERSWAGQLITAGERHAQNREVRATRGARAAYRSVQLGSNTVLPGPPRFVNSIRPHNTLGLAEHWLGGRTGNTDVTGRASQV